MPILDLGSEELPEEASTPDLYPYFEVSVLKLIVMAVSTWGLYQVFWHFKHWQAVGRRMRVSLWALPRAVFGPIFSFSLFSQLGLARSGVLAGSYLALNFLWRLPDPYWLLAHLSVIPLALVQKETNASNRPPRIDEHPRPVFSLLDILGIVLGSTVWLLFLVATFAPGE